MGYLFILMTSLILGTTGMQLPDKLIKVVSPHAWEESQAGGILICEPMDDEFIHMATDEQVERVISKFWNEREYILLYLDPTKLIGTIKYESNPGRQSKYYHLYGGYIPLSAVKETAKGK